MDYKLEDIERENVGGGDNSYLMDYDEKELDAEVASKTG